MRIIARLAALEARNRKDPLVVLASDPEGNTQKMTVEELLQSDGFGFVRVIGGSSLHDLDKILSVYHERALQGSVM